jgi:hypothetical protein
LDFFVSQSNSTACWPILAWSRARSRSKSPASALPELELKNAGSSLSHGLFPIGYLHRVDVKSLGDLLDGFDSLERFKCYTSFEFGVVSSSFAFHFMCVFGSA